MSSDKYIISHSHMALMMSFAKDTTSNLKHIIGPNGHDFGLSSLCVWHDVLWITTGKTHNVKMA